MPYFLEDEHINELRRIIAKVDSLRGDGVSNTPNAITIGRAASSRSLQSESDRIFPAKITSTFSAGYVWEEVSQNDNGTYTTLTDGRKSTDAGRSKAFEDNGNEDLDGSGTPVYVLLRERSDPDNGNLCYAFALGGGTLNISSSACGLSPDPLPVTQLTFGQEFQVQDNGGGDSSIFLPLASGDGSVSIITTPCGGYDVRVASSGCSASTFDINEFVSIADDGSTIYLRYRVTTIDPCTGDTTAGTDIDSPILTYEEC